MKYVLAPPEVIARFIIGGLGFLLMSVINLTRNSLSDRCISNISNTRKSVSSGFLNIDK